MGWLNLVIDDDLHTDLRALANQDDDCPDTLKGVVREALQDFNERKRAAADVDGGDGQ